MTTRLPPPTQAPPWWGGRVVKAGAGAVWRRPDFARLWTSQTVSQLGSEVTLLALPLAAVALGAGPKEMGWLATARFLPTLLLGFLAGTWVDRLPRRPLLIVTDLGRGVILACVPLAALTGHLRLELLYPVAFLINALAVLAEVAHASYLPALVERDRLVEANSSLAVGTQTVKIAGPSLAGALVQAATAPIALVVDAASFLVSSVLLGMIRTHEPARPKRPAGARTLWGEIGDGVRFVVAHPILRPLTVGWGLYYFAFFLFWGQYPLFATRDLGLSPAAFGLVGSLSAVAGVLGAVATRPVTARWGLGPTMAGAVLVGGLGTLLLSLAGGSALTAASVLVLGEALLRSTDQFFYINYSSVCQALTPDRLRGRVNASVRVFSAGTVPVAALIGGALGEVLGLRMTAVLAGVGVLLAFLWVALSPVRSLRTLPDDALASDLPPVSPDTESPAPSRDVPTPRQPVTERV